MGGKESSDWVSWDGASSRNEGFARDWCHLRAELLSCDIWPSAALSVKPLGGDRWLITGREKIACKASLTAATGRESCSTVLFTLAPFVRRHLLPVWSHLTGDLYRQQAAEPVFTWGSASANLNNLWWTGMSFIDVDVVKLAGRNPQTVHLVLVHIVWKLGSRLWTQAP